MQAAVDKYVIPLKDVTIKDVAIVGGKSASLGEMISQMSTQGIVVPCGFAVTAMAYREFIESNDAIDNLPFQTYANFFFLMIKYD